MVAQRTYRRPNADIWFVSTSICDDLTVWAVITIIRKLETKLVRIGLRIRKEIEQKA